MKRLLMAAAALMLTTAASGAVPVGDLSADVTRMQTKTDYVEFLMVVDNRSDRTYSWTDWSCVFFDGDTPVHETQVFVKNVLPNTKTVKSQVAIFDVVKFTRIACRPLTR
jgi:hypothetical protein